MYFEAKSPACPVVHGAVAFSSWWDERELHLVWALQVPNHIQGIPVFTHQRDVSHLNHRTSNSNNQQGKPQVPLFSLPVQGFA